jgi:ABC-2 type transport system permease protein
LQADLRKVWIVASTEFGSAIRTKSFILGIVFLPVITGLSVLIQLFIAKSVDTRPRTIAVVDGTGVLTTSLERAAAAFNSQTVDAAGKAVRPRIMVVREEARTKGEVDPAQKLELSDSVRQGKLDAFVVIPPGAIDVPSSSALAAPVLEFHSDNPSDDLLRNWLTASVSGEVRSQRFRSAGIDQSIADRIGQPLAVDNLGLFERDTFAKDGEVGIKPAQKVDPIRTFVVPAVLMFAMFFVIMTSSPQLLNSVLEEKMSKISEVLLGSLTPFELMLGKLLGNALVAVVLAVLYLGSGYAVAAYYGYADMVSPALFFALGVFLFVAILLFGSLYMAVGAACNELKDAQSLMMPVMMVSMLPAFVWMAVLKSPSSPLAIGLTLFPTATPFLMLMRLALRPAPPFWQVSLSIVLATVTAFFCVWAAAKIFRIGLLMQGKAPSFRELARWVVAK